MISPIYAPLDTRVRRGMGFSADIRTRALPRSGDGWGSIYHLIAEGIVERCETEVRANLHPMSVYPSYLYTTTDMRTKMVSYPSMITAEDNKILHMIAFLYARKP